MRECLRVCMCAHVCVQGSDDVKFNQSKINEKLLPMHRGADAGTLSKQLGWRISAGQIGVAEKNGWMTLQAKRLRQIPTVSDRYPALDLINESSGRDRSSVRYGMTSQFANNKK